MKVDAEEIFSFLVALTEASGKTLRELRVPALELLEISPKLNRLNENECNRELTQREVKQGERLDKRVNEIAAELGVTATLGGDPRGASIQLNYPGRHNGWGDGVIVP